MWWIQPEYRCLPTLAARLLAHNIIRGILSETNQTRVIDHVKVDLEPEMLNCKCFIGYHRCTIEAHEARYATLGARSRAAKQHQSNPCHGPHLRVDIGLEAVPR